MRIDVSPPGQSFGGSCNSHCCLLRGRRCTRGGTGPVLRLVVSFFEVRPLPHLFSIWVIVGSCLYLYKQTKNTLAMFPLYLPGVNPYIFRGKGHIVVREHPWVMTPMSALVMLSVAGSTFRYVKRPRAEKTNQKPQTQSFLSNVLSIMPPPPHLRRNCSGAIPMCR